MSAGSTLHTGQISTANAANPATKPLGKLRVWFIVALIAAFWAFLYANHNFETWMLVRFLSRLGAYAILLLASLAWWLSFSAISWRDRFGAIGVIAGSAAMAFAFADKSNSAFGLFLGAFPFALTIGVAWLLISRSFTPTGKRAGFCVLMLLTFGYFDLLRFDGLDAAQRVESSWRWTHTKEQVFLASTTSAAHASPAADSAPAKPWTPRPDDCLEYRGPNRDGVVTGITINPDWKEQPPKFLWREKVGPGWAGLIVVDGHIVTQEQRGELEAIVCHDATTGKEVWVHTDPVRFEESLAGAGPRSTPTFVDGRIYAMGAKATLNCLAAETGALIWSHDVMADAGVTPADMPQWGYSISPLVVDGLVIVFAGGTQDKSIFAYQASDGKLAWTRAGGKQSYSSPQLVTLDGQKQIVMHDSHGLTGLNIADGAVLWDVPGGSEMSLPMLQPHAADANTLVVSVNGGAEAFDIRRDGDKWTAKSRWTAKTFRADFNDFVIHKDCVYGLSDGVLCCLDLKTGEKLWKKGRLGHGQVLVLPDQDLLVVSSDKGEIILVSVNRKGYEELGRFQAIEGKTWNGLVIAEDKVLLRNGAEMAAFELLTQKSPPTTSQSSAATSQSSERADSSR